MTNSLSEQVAGLEKERDQLKADALSDLIKRRWLENQVRNREAERDESTRKNTLASWKVENLKFELDKVSGERKDLRAERDDLQRQVQEARDESRTLADANLDLQRQLQEARDHIEQLRAWRGQPPEAEEDHRPEPPPRVITVDELREGQVIAVWEPGPYGDVDGEVLRVHRLGTNEDGDTAAWKKHGGYWPVDESTQVVLLEDAPDREGPRSVPFGNQYYRYAILPDGEVVKNSDMTPDAEATESVAHHRDDDHQDAEITDWHDPVPRTAETMRALGDWRDRVNAALRSPRLTVHDLEVAPEGSQVEYGLVSTKRTSGQWGIGILRPTLSSEELLAKIRGEGALDDATLTTPEAQ